MRNIVRNNHGQFVIIAALLIAALTLATAISIHEITINRQSVNYKPAGEFLLGTTSDMNRALTVALAKYTTDTMNQVPTNNAAEFMTQWKQSLLTSYSAYNLKINSNLPQNLIPRFEVQWDGSLAYSYAYIPYNFDVDSYGFMGWTGSTEKYVQLQIFPETIDTNIAGQTSLVFQLTQSNINGNYSTPVPDLPNNPTPSTFSIGPYTPEQPFTHNNTPTLQYQGNGKYLATFNQIINPLTNGVRIDLSTPQDGIWVSASYYNYSPSLGASSASTLLSASNGASIELGNSVNDSVTVSGVLGAPNPTGPVVFQVKIPGSDTFTPYAIISLSSSGQATSSNYLPLSVGDYYFRAVYSGDVVYAGSQSGDLEEYLAVTKAVLNNDRISVKTQLSSATVALGGSVTDTVVVNVIGNPFPIPTGTVDFYASTNGGLSWTKYDTKTLTDGSATSSSHINNYDGTTYFEAVYSGDTNYDPAQSGPTEEPLIIQTGLSNPSSTVTSLSTGNGGTLSLGNPVFDSATVTGVTGEPNPAGTVIFQVKSPDSDWMPYSITRLDVSGYATSTSYFPLSAGDYYFRAVYGGDIVYTGSQSGDLDEKLTVTKAEANENGFAVQTQLSSATITWGSSMTDTAILSFLKNPFPTSTGTVDFYYSTDVGATWTKYDTKPLDNGFATSGSFTPPGFAPSLSGTCYFKAVYSGDANYNSAESGTKDEPLTVNSNAPGASGDYYLAASWCSGQDPFLTVDKAKVPPPPSHKVNPALSNGHLSLTVSSESPTPRIVTANIITMLYDIQIKQPGPVRADLSFSYNGQNYVIGSATFTANPINEYYTVPIDVTGKTFINGFTQQTIPAGATLKLTTTLLDSKNRVLLDFGLTGTQIVLYPS